MSTGAIIDSTYPGVPVPWPTAPLRTTRRSSTYIHLAGVGVDVRTANDKEGPCCSQRVVTGTMLSSTASIPWLREVIEGSLPPDADDDEVVTVDVLAHHRACLGQP